MKNTAAEAVVLVMTVKGAGDGRSITALVVVVLVWGIQCCSFLNGLSQI